MIQESDWTQVCKILEIRHSLQNMKKRQRSADSILVERTTKVFSIQAEKTLARTVQTDKETKQPLQGTVAWDFRVCFLACMDASSTKCEPLLVLYFYDSSLNWCTHFLFLCVSCQSFSEILRISRRRISKFVSGSPIFMFFWLAFPRGTLLRV